MHFFTFNPNLFIENLKKKKPKLTVADARKGTKPREQIRSEGLKKLELIQEACRINLDETVTEQVNIHYFASTVF